MILDLSILIICSVAIALLGLLIFVRNPSLANNRRFALLSAAMIAWTSFNYLSDHSTSHVLAYTRLTFFGGVAAIYTLTVFITNFPSDRAFYKNWWLRIHTATSFILFILAFLPAFITSVKLAADGSGSINTGPLYYLFLAYVVYSLALIFVLIRGQYKQATSIVQKQQVKTVSQGIIMYAILAVVSNVLLPLLSDSWSSSRLGPVFTLFLVGMVAYTIVKHRLFDIRLIVARSLGYIGSLGIITAVYGFIILGVARLVFGLNLSFQVQLFLSLATGLAGLYYQRIQDGFNRLTNKIFYRDAYDTQAFLEQFNKILASTYELSPLLKKSADIIESTIKPAYAAFGIKETANTPRRIVGTQGYPKFGEQDIALVRSLTPKTRRKVLVVDELEGKYEKLQTTLRDNSIAVLARLTSATAEEGIGYLILGPKKSGNPYSSQDLRVVEIIANELVVAIQNALHTEEIENFNLTLQAKVDDATRKLRATNEKLKALDETKDDFISMASHQLRTPLTSVKGYISMVLEGDAGKLNETQKKLLEQSFFSSQRMVFLIADLLNVSRLRTGKFVIEPAPVNLADMVEQEMQQLKETAAAKDMTFTYDKPKDFPTLMLDETKTRQVIMNFADNAIYYTPAGGHIRVELAETPASVELRVVDDGIGVPKSEQHHLFTKFYRAGNARKARPDGTGLGLFMAKKVIVAQGGAVIFESEENKGSTFGFVFSKTKLAPAGNPKPVAETAKA